jgi:hypothetical protein
LLSGRGLMTLPDTTTLASGHWNVDFNPDNLGAMGINNFSVRRQPEVQRT